MNISELPQGSYTPIQPQGQPQVTPPQAGQPLNINQLPQGSYQPVQPQQSPSVGGFLGNAVNSVGNFLGGIGTAIAHPIQTGQNLLNVAGGAVDEGLNTVAGTNYNNQMTQSFDALKTYYNNRYGISDLAQGNFQGAIGKIATTLYQDPAGAAADLSVLFDGGGALISKLGDFGEEGNVLSKVGEATQGVGESLNPANIGTKPVSALGEGFSGLQDSMEEANLRLTPTQRVNLGNRISSITGFISDNLPVGSPEARFNTASNITDSMEKTLQSTLQDDPVISKLSVPKAQVISQLQALPDTFKDDPAIYPLAKRQITEAAQAIQDTQGENISLSDLNKIKRSYSGNAFDQLGVKLKSEVKLAISSVPRTLIEDTLANNNELVDIPTKLQPLFGGQESVPIKEFNKVYGTAIQSKTFLKLAMGKPEAGLIARLLSEGGGAAVGSVVGGPIGAAGGAFAADTLARNFATPIRSIVGKAGEATGNVLSKANELAKPALYASQAGNVKRNIKIKR